MPIQFLCPECGKWLQVPAEHIGSTARCPECDHQSTIPEESDRPIAEDICFYCNAPVKQANKKAQPNEFPTCEDCRESMEINSREIAEEIAESDRLKAVGIRLALLVFGAILLYWLVSSLYNWLTATQSAAPAHTTCTFARVACTATAGLPALGVLARAE